MIEKCNFKYGWIDQEGHTILDNPIDGKFRCRLADGMECPGEMNCILYMLYYDDEL